MRNSYFLIIAILCTVFLTSAGATSAAEIASAEYRATNNDVVPSLRILAGGDRIAVNPGIDGAIYADMANGSILILDGEKGELVDVVALVEVARQMGFGTNGAGGNAALQQGLSTADAAMKAQIDKMLESVPENQRAMLRAQLEKQFNLGAGAGISAVPSGDLRADPTGNSKIIGEHNAGEVNIFRNDELVRTVWITDADNLEGGKLLLNAVSRFDDLYDKTVKGLPGAGDRSFFSDMHLLGGLPVAAKVIDENTDWVYVGPVSPAASEADLAPPDLPIRRKP